MKKVLLTALMVGACASLYAQGTIKFANTATSLVYGPDGTTPVPSANFHVSLWWNSTGATSAAGSTDAQMVAVGPTGVGEFAVGGLIAGRFSYGTSPFVTGSQTAPSGTGVFEVRGWTGNFTTYAAAYADALAGGGEWVGESAFFTSPTGGGGTPPATPPSNLGANFTGMTLQPVPEPGTLALGGLGAAALLLFRRRK